MKMSFFAIRDLSVGAFMRPFVMQSTAQAVRSFGDEVNRQAADNMMYSHPEDFELWLLGDFDDSDPPFIVGNSDPKRVAAAVDLKMPVSLPR